MRREIDFRYRVLRSGAVFGELHASPDASAPVIRMDDSAEIKTALSGTFLPEVTDADGRTVEADWLSDEIQPVMIIDGVEHPLGIYAAATVTPYRSLGAESMRIEAYDRCWRVRDLYTTNRMYLESGTAYLTPINNMIKNAGVKLIMATPSAATFAEDRQDWDPGTSCLSVVNELLGEINYNPLWFDSNGYAILSPVQTPSVDNIKHTLDADDVRSLMIPQISMESDYFSAPNVFLCMCSNPDKGEPLTATAENNNPQSPISIPRRGRRIMKVVQLNNIASQEALQAYAEKLRNDSLIGGETIRISTALLPGYGVGDVVALHYGEISALCVERAWTMKLRVGGTMQHILERVVYNLG